MRKAAVFDVLASAIDVSLVLAVNAAPRQILRANGLAACAALVFWSALADGKE